MENILENVIDEFKKLAAIPRPSKHEERVSDFLRDYLKSFGLTVAQDDYKNVIAEIPAKGKDSALTILQAHMDMVCVAENGVDYDPLRDSVKLIRTEKYLTADGTSLGADDGIGIAEILYIVKNADKFPHGKIRVIFTTDEEQGMSGALNLDAKYFADAAYLINCDSENFNELVVGSAGNIHVDFSRRIEYVEPKFANAFRVKISGLSGGHSGIEITNNRANAVKVAEKFLRQLGEVELSKIDSGTAPNVIPDAAEIILVTNLELAEMDERAAWLKKNIFEIYAENLEVDIAEIALPKKVMSAADLAALTNFLAIVHSGVYSVFGEMARTSANIGILRTAEEIEINILARANITALLEDFTAHFAQVAKLTGFGVKFGTPTPAWNYNPKNRLAEIMSKIFAEQNNFCAKVHTIHAGLECSCFSVKNPALDIVSIGTTNEFIHSPQERLHLETVEPEVRLIVETLKQI